MRKSLNRREAARRLAGAAAAMLAGVAPYSFVRSAASQPVGRRAIVLGGGFAGATVAAELRRLAPGFETILIDPAESFFSQPASLDVVFGRRTLSDATRSYASLVQAGVKVVKAAAAGIDSNRRAVATDAGAFAYDALVLATGASLTTEKVAGLSGAPETNVSLYDRARLLELKSRIEALGAGTAVIGIPAGAIKCPPAPYEFALQLAERIKSVRTKGKVVVLDAWPTPQPGAISNALAAAIAAHADTIEYVGPVNIARVDTQARRVFTVEGDEFNYDLLSLVPSHTVHRFVSDLRFAGEGDVFVDVDPITQRARESDSIYAVGDVARVPFGKSAGAAVGAARLCARAVARALGAAVVPDPAGDVVTVETACYPQVQPDKALALITGFTLTPRKDAPPGLESRASAETAPTAENLSRRQAWETTTLRAIFGA